MMPSGDPLSVFFRKPLSVGSDFFDKSIIAYFQTKNKS